LRQGRFVGEENPFNENVAAILNMHLYLFYSPIIIFLVWLYLLSRNVQSLRQIKKLSGKSYFYIFTVLPFSTDQNTPYNNELEEAIANHKRLSKKLFKIWAVTILIYIIVTMAVGIITAKQ
jgi:hypothetical protein